jgi:putative endonuclease
VTHAIPIRAIRWIFDRASIKNDMWLCYILYGKLEGRMLIYVGKTNDMERRLRQHRGELSGGAKYTKRYRMQGVQWNVSAVNHGFETEREAMVFESQLQRPKDGLLVREHYQTLRYEALLPRTLKLALLLAKNPRFSRINLVVHDSVGYSIDAPLKVERVEEVKRVPIVKEPRKPRESKIDSRINKYKARLENYERQRMAILN